VTLLGRIVVIVFALWLATAAAGIAFSIGFLGPQWPALSGDPGERVIFWGATLIASGITATLIFLPMLLAVVLAEALSIRSLLIYAAGGAAIMLIAYYGTDFGRSYEESIDAAPPLLSRGAELAAVAGIVFGLVYWAVAGRSAGRWRTRV
jgi:hypothetical protein